MKYLALVLLFASALANEDDTLGMSEANPASSCNEIYQRNPTSRGNVGQYWIKTTKGLFKVTCNMNLKCGGVEGGWMQVVDIDMNRDDSCPGTWRKIVIPRRLCVGSLAAGCASAHFYTKGVSYSQICGQAKGYQKGKTNGFFTSRSVDTSYADGISITIGSPRKHVWTYAVGMSDNHDYSGRNNCPCATHPGPSPPAFVGNDYYCESGDVGDTDPSSYFMSDPLWDGSGCTTGNGCCAQIGMPWFCRKLPLPVTDDLEIRICKDEPYSNEDTTVEKIEIFVN